MLLQTPTLRLLPLPLLAQAPLLLPLSRRARSSSSARAISARNTEPTYSSNGFLAVSAHSFFQP
ncbi:hypothetical protein ACFV19_20830 [Streptomyces griseoluteus]|uniref:hypothetical protein n=1 Tax=Streptomyces griseoluteus TaxID=29306 RepID=UPI0036B7D1E2